MPTAPAAKPETSVKDTIESILVAFILAFVFRCFVIEAFVIPTGSMAPTLMGAHLALRCPDCGYRFEAGYEVDQQSFAVDDAATYRSTDRNSRPVAEPKTYGLFCPNCGYRLPPNLPEDPANDATAPVVRYGDRILVMKYLYLLHEPRRWDVVVFKSPDTETGDYSTNFIKRLVATPGESAFVAGGDLYVARPEDRKPDANGNLPPLQPGDFKVRPKPRHVQDALWRIVFDADHVPIGRDRTYVDSNVPVGRRIEDKKWQQPWRQTSGAGWLNDDDSAGVSARQFRFDGAGQAGTLAFDPNANPTTSSFTDWLAYDQTDGQMRRGRDTLAAQPYGPGRTVADLKVAFTSDGLAGNGALRAILGRTAADNPSNRTDVVAELTAHKVRVLLRDGHGETTIGERAIDMAGRREVSLENVDYRITLRIDGRDEIVSTEEQYRPSVQQVISEPKPEANPPQDQPPTVVARIEGQDCRVTLSHLQLWRDVYYRDDAVGTSLRATSRDFPNAVVTLGPDEFFVLGDNSTMSRDGRFWQAEVDLEGEDLSAPAGVVPGRFLLGKAFFVYWPAGFRPAENIRFGIVPNFGEMRFIR